MSDNSKDYDYNDYISLRRKAPLANDIVLNCEDNICSENYAITTVTWYVDKECDWLLHLKCNVCNTKWNVCATCPNFKGIMRTKRQISNHRNTYHKAISITKRCNLKEDTISNKKRKANCVTGNNSNNNSILPATRTQGQETHLLFCELNNNIENNVKQKEDYTDYGLLDGNLSDHSITDFMNTNDKDSLPNHDMVVTTVQNTDLVKLELNQDLVDNLIKLMSVKKKFNLVNTVDLVQSINCDLAKSDLVVEDNLVFRNVKSNFVNYVMTNDLVMKTDPNSDLVIEQHLVHLKNNLVQIISSGLGKCDSDSTYSSNNTDLAYLSKVNDAIQSNMNLIKKGDFISLKNRLIEMSNSSSHGINDTSMHADGNNNSGTRDDNLVYFNQEIMNSLNTIFNSIASNVDKYEMNKKAVFFYSHDIVSSGKKYIVSQMCADKDNTQHDIFQKISDLEVQFQITMSRFVYNLTRSQQKQFGELLNLLHDIVINKKVHPVCHIPSSYEDLRKLYLDSNLAITKHVPIPEVNMKGDHSFISLLDCVSDFLIRKDDIMTNVNEWDLILNDNNYNNQMYIFSCERVTEILDDAKGRVSNVVLDHTLPMVPIFLTMWSDDFDPNKSIKSNRQSVWIKTVTIFTMNKVGKKIQITYPLSLSMKGLDHEIVEEMFLNDVNALRRGKILTMYSRSHSTFVFVHADIFCVLNDQPERRSNLKLAYGNSLLHGRFGHILDVRQVKDNIKSCNDCSDSIIDEATQNFSNNIQNLSYEWRIGNCAKCTSWLYHINNKMLHYCPDKDYPTALFGNEMSDGKLKPKMISFTTIETGINKVMNYLENKKIKQNEAKSFMRYLGINNVAQEQVIMIATNRRKYNDAVKDKNNNNDRYNELIKDKKNHPYHYNSYKLPSAYYGFTDLSVFVEAPMHLLMLGVMKTVMIKIGTWLRSIKQNSNFLLLVKGKLSIIKCMNLEWCKILEYPTTEKTGGWVSENFLAISRLSVWFYSFLFLLPINEQYIDPTADFSSWNKLQCETWLEARGISKNGSASDLRGQIGEYIINNKIPPIKKKDEFGVLDIMKLLQSTTLMIANLMSLSTKKEDIARIEAIIRMFLYHYDRIDMIHNEDKIPSWIQKYNMLCLLNIPKIMQKYGHVRNIWEGGKDGEAYLKQVKHNLKAGLVNRWQSWVLNNLLKDEIYDSWKNDNVVQHNVRDLVKVYGTYEKAKEVFNKGIPISTICYNKNIYICYRFKGSIKAIMIKLSTETKTEFNLLYYSLTWTSKYIEITNETQKYIGVLFLPKPTKEDKKNDTSILYCYVTSDWSALCHSNIE